MIVGLFSSEVSAIPTSTPIQFSFSEAATLKEPFISCSRGMGEGIKVQNCSELPCFSNKGIVCRSFTGHPYLTALTRFSVCHRSSSWRDSRLQARGRNAYGPSALAVSCRSLWLPVSLTRGQVRLGPESESSLALLEFLSLYKRQHLTVFRTWCRAQVKIDSWLLGTWKQTNK